MRPMDMRLEGMRVPVLRMTGVVVTVAGGMMIMRLGRTLRARSAGNWVGYCEHDYVIV